MPPTMDFKNYCHVTKTGSDSIPFVYVMSRVQKQKASKSIVSDEFVK